MIVCITPSQDHHNQGDGIPVKPTLPHSGSSCWVFANEGKKSSPLLINKRSPRGHVSSKVFLIPHAHVACTDTSVLQLQEPLFLVIHIPFLLASSIYFFVHSDFITRSLLKLNPKYLIVQLAPCASGQLSACSWSGKAKPASRYLNAAHLKLLDQEREHPEKT